MTLSLDEDFRQLEAQFNSRKNQLIKKISSLTNTLENEVTILEERNASSSPRMTSAFASYNGFKSLFTAPLTIFGNIFTQIYSKKPKIEYLKKLKTALEKHTFNDDPVELDKIYTDKQCGNQYRFATQGVTSRVASLVEDVSYLMNTAKNINDTYNQLSHENMKTAQ